MIYSPDSTGQVLALLDWELSTLGYPLADLAYSAMCYHFPMSDKTGVRGLPRPLPDGRGYLLFASTIMLVQCVSQSEHVCTDVSLASLKLATEA